MNQPDTQPGTQPNPVSQPDTDTPASRLPLAAGSQWNRLLPLLVLLLVLALSVVLSAVVSHFIREQQRARFQREVTAHSAALSGRIADFDKLLQATRAFWLANPTDITPESFAQFSNALSLSERYPEVQALGFDAWLPTGQEQTLVTLVNSLGVRDFQVTPAQTDQQMRAPIVLIAPLTPTNIAARGFDMMTSEQRREALLRASHTNSSQITTPLALTQRDSSGRPYAGFLVILPVWRDDADNRANTSANHDADDLTGFIYLAVRSDAFYKSLLSAYSLPGIQADISLGNMPLLGPEALTQDFRTTDKLKLGGQNWTIDYAAPRDFGRDIFWVVPYLTLLAGFLIGIAAFRLMAEQIVAREYAEKNARNLRLSQARQEQSRAEFEAIFQSMQDAATFTDAGGRVRMVNRALSEQLGYLRGDLEGKPLSTLHFDRRLDRSASFLALTTPFKRKDGSRFQGEAQRSQVKDANGELLGLLEVVRDVTERVASEQALQAEEKRSRAVLDAVPHILWVSDTRGQVTYMNAQHRKRLGNLSLREAVHPADLAAYDQMWQQAYNWRSRAQCEARLLVASAAHATSSQPSNSRSRWFDIRVTPLLDEQGRAREWVASATDTHDRLMAERLAQRNEARYRGVVEGMPQIVWLANAQGQLTYFNRRWQDYVGEERAGLDATGALDFAGALHPDDRQEYQESWARAVAAGQPYEAEHRLLGADGLYRTFVTRGLGVTDAQGQIIEWVGTSTDVDDSVYAEYTARLLAHISDELSRRINDSLAGRATKYQAVLGLLTERLMVAGALWVAPELDLLALSSRHKNWDLPHVQAEIYELVAQVARRGDTLDIPTHPLLHVVAASGAVITPLIGLDGTLRGVLGLAYRQELRDRDHELIMEIAARLAEALDNDALRAHAQAAQQELLNLNQSLEDRVQRRTLELQEANRELEAFSYSVSHDLRTPLRHIVSFGEMLQKDSGGVLSAKSTRYLGVMTEAAGRMNVLIESLLEFSRMGRTPLRLVPVELGPLVQQAWRNLEPDLQSREPGGEVQFVLGDLPTVQGDPNLLDLVFQNLLSNAIKYSRKQPQALIVVAAEPQQADDAVTIRVQDNGVGFDPKYTDKLFGVFQRLHRAEEFEGTGIGLANVRRIVARHGGSIRAESELGAGATFYVTLPTQAAELNQQEKNNV